MYGTLSEAKLQEYRQIATNNETMLGGGNEQTDNKSNENQGENVEAVETG